jgi:hypothetical protein
MVVLELVDYRFHPGNTRVIKNSGENRGFFIKHESKDEKNENFLNMQLERIRTKKFKKTVDRFERYYNGYEVMDKASGNRRFKQYQGESVRPMQVLASLGYRCRRRRAN